MRSGIECEVDVNGDEDFIRDLGLDEHMRVVIHVSTLYIRTTLLDWICASETPTLHRYTNGFGLQAYLAMAANGSAPLSKRSTGRACMSNCSSPLPNVAKRVADTVYKVVSRLKEWIYW